MAKKVSPSPKKQHYVPQFLLRGFANADERIFIFDKATGQVRQQLVREVGHENRTYEVQTHAGEKISLEGRLARMEAASAPILAKLISGIAAVNDLTTKERNAIAFFAAVQLLRVPHMRANLRAMNDGVLRVLMARAGKGGIGKELLNELENFDKDTAKRISLKSIVQDAPTFAGHINAKKWVLQCAIGAGSFYIGDNPIARMNQIDQPHRGNLGLTCAGIEIYLPLSPRITLAFLDPMLVDRIILREEQLGSNKEAGGWKIGKVSMSDANVEHLNSLQVIEAERFIFSQSDDFNLVREMIEAHPHLKEGPRTLIS